MATPAMSTHVNDRGHRLMRVPDARRHDPAIDAWLASRPAPLGAIAQRWFSVMRGCGDDVRERLHDGHPTACIGEAAFAYVDVFTSHVNVGFFQGAALADPDRLLEGTGRFMRHVKLKPDAAFRDVALLRLIESAATDVRMRLSANDW
jgi:hypothetical protein